MDQENRCEVMAIGAHPDDVELTCGGTIIKLQKEEKNVVIVDCTEGEMGSRGTTSTRAKEAEAASKVMGIWERVNLKIEDGNIEISKKNISKVVWAIRKYRPEIILFPAAFDRHPDHESANRLVRTAVFNSGLIKIETLDHGEKQIPFRPKRMLCYMQTYDFTPDFYVDITEVYEEKIKAIQAYGTQFYTGKKEQSTSDPETFISKPDFMEFLEARARYFGGKVGVRYAEAFASIEPIGLKSLSLLL